MRKFLTWIRTRLDRIVAREFLMIEVYGLFYNEETKTVKTSLLFKGTHLDAMMYCRLAEMANVTAHGNVEVRFSIVSDPYV